MRVRHVLHLPSPQENICHLKAAFDAIGGNVCRLISNHRLRFSVCQPSKDCILLDGTFALPAWTPSHPDYENMAFQNVFDDMVCPKWQGKEHGGDLTALQLRSQSKWWLW